MNQDHQYYQQVGVSELGTSDHDFNQVEMKQFEVENSSGQPTVKQSLRQKRQNKFLWITIGLGVLLHLLFLFSIFDVYIQSWRPMGMNPVEPLNTKPLAKRLMLFQYDGGRSDIIYGFQTEPDEKNIGEPRVPLIHKRVKGGKASFGLQYASVPTESRVCVQSMMGGYQEDMTAILSGWANSHGLQYDRIYNYVKAGFFFGPSVIRGIFESKKCPQCVRVDDFPDSQINYYDHVQAMRFDAMNYGKIKRLFNGTLEQDSKIDPKDSTKVAGDELKLKEDKLMVYMNWVSCDAIGTGFKPINQEYRKSIRVTGEFIEEIEQNIIDYYGDDGETAFILLADHGIADIGAHGDGHPQNTWTPFIIWGKGVKPAEDEADPNNPETHDDFSKKWGLTMKKRFDIEQNQMPGLIASLLGLPIPVNNEGVLPLELLDATGVYKANVLLQNAYQLQASYQKVQDLVQERQKWFFSEYTYSPSTILSHLDEMKAEVEQIAKESEDGTKASKEQDEELKRIIQDTYESISRIKKGVEYLKLFQKTLLQSAVALGYIGFMLFCFVQMFRYVNTSSDREEEIVEQNKSTLLKNTSLMFTLFLAAFAVVYLNVTESKPVYYAYFGFPIFFFYRLYRQRKFFNEGWNGNCFLTLGKYLILALGGLCLMYSFFDREFISYNFIAISILSVIHSKFSFGSVPCVVLRWSLACLLISIFPLLPPLIGYNDTYYQIGFASMTAITFYISFIHYKNELQTSVKLMTMLILYCGGISMYLRTVQSSQVPDYIFGINWGILFTLTASVFVLDLHKRSNQMLRFYSFVIIMCNITLLFGISYDILFFLIFIFLLKSWIDHEEYVSVHTDLHQKDQGKIFPSHFYTAFKFILIMNISFFGIQDLVSLGSFNYENVTRFIVNLKEILTLVLMVVKLAGPFLSGATAFICVCKAAYKQINSVGLFILSIIFAEVMAISFFFMVRTEGTWQEKGSSVARFVISSSLTLLYTFLFFVAHQLFKHTKKNDAHQE